MPDLATWLLERIAEDEAEARYWTCDCAIEGFPLRHGLGCEERVKAECESKRRIVEAYREERYRRNAYQADEARAVEVDDQARRRRSSAARCRGLEIAVQLLALPYADHQDYNPEWRP